MILWYFHPHPVGGMSLPNHCCTCKYVRKECCRAAALVGGNAARVNVAPIGNIPVIILIIMIGIIMSYTTCTRPTWLTFNLHTKQEKNCCKRNHQLRRSCTSWSNRNAENGWQNFLITVNPLQLFSRIPCIMNSSSELSSFFKV